MARLTKAAAARELGISRTTLYKLIDQGQLSATPDGLVDSTELVRVAPVVDTLKERARTSIHTASPPPMDSDITRHAHREHVVDSHHEHPWTAVHEREQTSTDMPLVDILREQVEAMRHELQAAREERQAAREERAMLLQMLQQMQHRYDRLLDAPRLSFEPPAHQRPPVPSVAEAPRGAVPPLTPDPVPLAWPPTPVASTPYPPRGALRQGILTVLHAHPEGLTTVELRILLRVDRSLTDVCSGMLRNGLLRRVGRGRYVVAAEGHGT